MRHPIYRVRSFEIITDYTLHIVFNDGIEKTINFLPSLAGDLYRPLRNLTLFNQVKLDPEVHTLVWPNDADFDPATLHDWSTAEEVEDAAFFNSVRSVDTNENEVAQNVPDVHEPYAVVRAD